MFHPALSFSSSTAGHYRSYPLAQPRFKGAEKKDENTRSDLEKEIDAKIAEIELAKEKDFQGLELETLKNEIFKKIEGTVSRGGAIKGVELNPQISDATEFKQLIESGEPFITVTPEPGRSEEMITSRLTVVADAELDTEKNELYATMENDAFREQGERLPNKVFLSFPWFDEATQKTYSIPMVINFPTVRRLD